ncbi:chorismate synthase [uncultured Eubacterium sp.]|uniref:chorismate synthase n=1 Tax=uncultured Eubacterium sp. TaxID=165185 RepID=UPI0025F7C267|nr:chorismate synthase [uncultured Eubacterium sp.]
MSSVIGDKIKLSIFGESHGEAIGCVIDGLPAGIKIDMNAVYKDMQRRAPGKDKTATPRLEKDIPHILSGMLDNVTTGAPLAMVIENTNTKSGDYSNLMTVPRPGHSDYPAYVKYGGNNDIRGGGHFSGRLTAPLVFAGSVAKQILSQMGVTIGAHIKQIGSVCDAVSDLNKTDKSLLDTLSSSTFSLIDETKEQAMRDEIEKARLSLDSVGGIIECFAVGLPVGLGGNMFDTVEGKLASILFGVPAVKGVEFGIGFGFVNKRASEVNDQYEIKNGRVATLSNNNGGVLGGMTDGAPLSVSVAIKPTPSIAKKQKSVNLLTMENAELEIHGRHDPCIVVRAVPVIECAVALGLLDLMM